MANAHSTPTPTVVTFNSGSEFSIRIRTHEITVDQTMAGGGLDSAPTPIELLGASLGSCIAYYVHRFFHTRGLPADDIRVEVTSHSACNPSRIESFDVKLHLPATVDPKHMPLLERVIHSCPAHNTLVMGAKMNVEYAAPLAEPAVV
jgi:uncharacterized OsmC-like protein